MSPKRTTAPPARKRSRSSSSGQERLIAKEKRLSAKTRIALDNRFHRTDQTLSCAAKAHVPKPERHAARLHVRRADARRVTP